MKILLIFFFCSFTLVTYSQVGINTTSPDSSSALDISSSVGGILIPRLTSTQKSNISNPATGLMIYQIDSTPGFYFYNGQNWQQLITSVNILIDSSNIQDGTITSDDLSTGISTTKLGDGSVSDTELGYIDGLTSNAQTQLSGLDVRLTTNTNSISTNASDIGSNTSSITTLSNTISNLTDSDTTYSSGTGLTLNGTTFNIDSSVVTSTYTGGVTINGTVTATKFVGDGSGLI